MSEREFSKERSLRVSKAIDQAMLRAVSAASAEVIVIFDICHSNLISSQLPSHAEKREIARRICEAKISELHHRRGPRKEFLSTWLEMEALGYSSMEREASMLFFYIRFMENNGTEEAVSVALSRFAVLVDRMVAVKAPRLGAHFKRVLKRLRQSRKKRLEERLGQIPMGDGLRRPP
jgi:hypothetical protein